MHTWNTQTIINHFIQYFTKVTAFIVPNQTQDTVYCLGPQQRYKVAALIIGLIRYLCIYIFSLNSP